MTRIIVTGGAGRLGRSVVSVLADAGNDVISVDRMPHSARFARSESCDLEDPTATRQLFEAVRADTVVHLAAIAVPFGRPDLELYATNTGLALSVLQATVASGATSLLFASSPTVIGYGAPGGWHPTALPIDETHPVAPWNAYSLSKQAVENIAALAVRVHGDRLRVGVFRPCYVIAPEEWQGAPTQQGHSVRDRLDDPELSAVALFNYLDARDAGEFVLAWNEKVHGIPNGTVFFVGARDSLIREPLVPSIARYRPELAADAAALADHEAVFSSRLAEELLGWRASRTWRSELALDRAHS